MPHQHLLSWDHFTMTSLDGTSCPELLSHVEVSLVLRLLGFAQSRWNRLESLGGTERVRYCGVDEEIEFSWEREQGR
jgi:hypothetical protein